MMKVGIAQWRGRVSPVFDAATSLLLVEIEAGEAVQRASVPLASSDALERAKQVSALGTELLICGTVSRPFEMALLSAGVKVIPCICGNIEEVLGAFLDGRLEREHAFLLPGCCGRRDWGSQENVRESWRNQSAGQES
jgi:predicted Fe-Mo cluster-binding NifX family protein